MSRPGKHLVVVLLLLLFIGEAVGSVAAGLSHCDGRCECCDQPLHRAGIAQKATVPRHPTAITSPRMGPQGGCCMPSMLTDCDQDQVRNLALISTPPLTGQQARLRLSTTAVSAAALAGPGRASRDPYAATLLARVTAIPIFLQTAVFLC